MKLTNEEIAKVFAMYLGSGYKHKLANEYGVIDLHNIKHAYEYGYMLLTLLSKISDDDAIEVAKLVIKNTEFKVYYRNEKYIEVSSKYYTLGIDCNFTFKLTYKDGVLDRIDMPISNYCIVCIFQYLISQSYAVPLFFSPGHWANGKTAIELGIAIEK